MDLLDFLDPFSGLLDLALLRSLLDLLFLDLSSSESLDELLRDLRFLEDFLNQETKFRLFKL